MSEPAPSSEPTTRRRRWPWLAGLALLVVLLAESLLPPHRQPTARMLLTGIDLYQGLISPRLAKSGVHCRFEPTCSRYGEAVLRRYGTLRGVGLTAGRLLRCGPWTPAGTEDPPPGRELG